MKKHANQGERGKKLGGGGGAKPNRPAFFGEGWIEWKGRFGSKKGLGNISQEFASEHLESPKGLRTGGGESTTKLGGAQGKTHQTLVAKTLGSTRTGVCVQREGGVKKKMLGMIGEQNRIKRGNEKKEP